LVGNQIAESALLLTECRVSPAARRLTILARRR
jgi:hypothetical protein